MTDVAQIAGVVETLYALVVFAFGWEVAQVWFRANRASRRCTREARRLAVLAIALVLTMGAPVVAGVMPAFWMLPTALLVWLIARLVRRGGVVIRSSLTRPALP